MENLVTQSVERVVTACRDSFGSPAAVVRSPGRINLIGEHTDHNLGFVLPGAVDRSIILALRLRDDRAVRLIALDKAERHDTTLDDLRPVASQWPNYLLGILTELAALGHELRGVDCVFGGDVPIGSGLSSSAALECGFAFGLNELLGTGLGRVELAQLSQRSENRFVGVNCGIMDPFASCLGRDRRLIRLDCRDLSYTYVPFERDDLRIVLCDSQVPRTLTTSAYNLRRAQCEQGVARLQRHHPEIRSLRDATPAAVEALRDELEPEVYRRCAYVVAENLRVLATCEALERGDLRAVGAAMNATHEGLAHGYEVSCPEIDVLAAAAQALPGVLGSRMMGGGFGGCTINLVEADHLAGFEAAMAKVFRDQLGKPAISHVCRLTAGTERLG
jgi:galactokinase